MSGSNHDEGRSFPQTRWSLVARAGRSAAGCQALSELLTRYLPAMRAHLLYRKRIHPNDVDDLLQGFVANKVLEQNLVSVADQNRGRFRSFMLTSLDRYVINALRDRDAEKRSSGRAVVPLDELANVAEERAGPDPFDVVWAQDVIREALRRMQFECEVSGRSDLWTLFDARVAGPLLRGTAPVAYEQLVAKLRYDRPAQATNALATAKRMFQRMLRAVVSEYVESEAEIDEEISDLKRILEEARL